MKKYITLHKNGQELLLERDSIRLYTDPGGGIDTKTLSFGKVGGVDFGYEDLKRALELEKEEKRDSQIEVPKAHLKGRIIRFLDKARIIALILTESDVESPIEINTALLDTNTDFEWNPAPGDEVEIEDADWYVQNGRVVTLAGGRIVQIYKIPTGKYWRLIG